MVKNMNAIEWIQQLPIGLSFEEFDTLLWNERKKLTYTAELEYDGLWEEYLVFHEEGEELYDQNLFKPRNDYEIIKSKREVIGSYLIVEKGK